MDVDSDNLGETADPKRKKDNGVEKECTFRRKSPRINSIVKRGGERSISTPNSPTESPVDDRMFDLVMKGMEHLNAGGISGIETEKEMKHFASWWENQKDSL